MLNKSCDVLSGVGPQLAAKLEKKGLKTLQDLLFHLPYKYQDRTRITPISAIRGNDWCVIQGHVIKSDVTMGKRASLQCVLDDKTGLITLRFFHFNKSQKASLSVGTQLRLFGEVRHFNGQYSMVHPEYRPIEPGEEPYVEEHLTPIYPSTQGLSQTRLRQIIALALESVNHQDESLELLPKNLLNNSDYPNIIEAITYLHRPPPDAAVELLLEGQHPAQQRLAFEELLSNYLSLRQARARIKKHVAPAFNGKDSLSRKLIKSLPFKLTQAQSRVYDEIYSDLHHAVPMQRLVQGDVGSGKTIIAALAALKAIESGHQVALMAPTEILAEQHVTQFQQWFGPLGISVCRLLGKQGLKARRETLEQIQTHGAHIVIGTHALFQEQVKFACLGLVIIDEQHRFGVEQRLQLSKKGQEGKLFPHQLIMTATPIPRTLAMTSYADLDISVIDELPPGRTPIQTALISNSKRHDLIERLHLAVREKKQVYWVCTLIEESEKLQCMAAENTTQILKELLPKARIGLIHGRMKTQEKDAVMTAFKCHDLDLLVATTVIEVGVNVPNASLMIIENPERLGLSQLHQLRGRVGRGDKQSHCVLLYQAPLSLIAKERLMVMRDTTDGFVIAEKDLRIRGPGEILGTKQTGGMQFKIADILRDQELFKAMPHTAQQLLKDTPEVVPALIQRWKGESTQFLTS